MFTFFLSEIRTSVPKIFLTNYVLLLAKPSNFNDLDFDILKVIFSKLSDEERRAFCMPWYLLCTFGASLLCMHNISWIVGGLRSERPLLVLFKRYKTDNMICSVGPRPNKKLHLAAEITHAPSPSFLTSRA